MPEALAPAMPRPGDQPPAGMHVRRWGGKQIPTSARDASLLEILTLPKPHLRMREYPRMVHEAARDLVREIHPKKSLQSTVSVAMKSGVFWLLPVHPALRVAGGLAVLYALRPKPETFTRELVGGPLRRTVAVTKEAERMLAAGEITDKSDVKTLQQAAVRVRDRAMEAYVKKHPLEAQRIGELFPQATNQELANAIFLTTSQQEGLTQLKELRQVFPTASLLQLTVLAQLEAVRPEMRVIGKLLQEKYSESGVEEIVRLLSLHAQSARDVRVVAGLAQQAGLADVIRQVEVRQESNVQSKELVKEFVKVFSSMAGLMTVSTVAFAALFSFLLGNLPFAGAGILASMGVFALMRVPFHIVKAVKKARKNFQKQQYDNAFSLSYA